MSAEIKWNLAKANRKNSLIALEIFNELRKNLLNTLFSMPVSNSQLLRRFIELLHEVFSEHMKMGNTEEKLFKAIDSVLHTNDPMP